MGKTKIGSVSVEKLHSKNENKIEMEVDNNKTMLQQKLQRAFIGFCLRVFFNGRLQNSDKNDCV